VGLKTACLASLCSIFRTRQPTRQDSKPPPDAKPVQDQLVPVMAHVSINFVMKFTYCAELRVGVGGGEMAKGR
jgi:hypothetical protein